MGKLILLKVKPTIKCFLFEFLAKYFVENCVFKEKNYLIGNSYILDT